MNGKEEHSPRSSERDIPVKFTIMMPSLNSFWRDPDPVRRWAAGQFTRRWWRLPLARSLAVMAGLSALVIAVVLQAMVFWSYKAHRFHELAFLIAADSYICISVGIILLGCVKSMFPASNRLRSPGGRAMLRDLSLTSLTTARIGRLLYRGSWMRFAAPCLLSLFASEILLVAAAIGFCVVTNEVLLPQSGADRWLAAFILFSATAMPVLEIAMNLALGWRLAFRSRRDGSTMLAGLGVLMAFPLLFALTAALIALSFETPLAAVGAAALLACIGAVAVFLFVFSLPRLNWLAPLAVLLVLAAGFPWLLRVLSDAGDQYWAWVRSRGAIAPRPTAIPFIWLSMLTIWTVKGWMAIYAYRGLGRDFQNWLERTNL